VPAGLRVGRVFVKGLLKYSIPERVNMAPAILKTNLVLPWNLTANECQFIFLTNKFSEELKNLST